MKSYISYLTPFDTAPNIIHIYINCYKYEEIRIMIKNQLYRSCKNT